MNTLYVNFKFSLTPPPPPAPSADQVCLSHGPISVSYDGCEASLVSAHLPPPLTPHLILLFRHSFSLGEKLHCDPSRSANLPPHGLPPLLLWPNESKDIRTRKFKKCSDRSVWKCVSSLLSLGNFKRTDRPTNQRTNIRVKREVEFPMSKYLQVSCDERHTGKKEMFGS